jgi:hypothetical protein
MKLLRNRHARRLLFALLALAGIDPVVSAVLDRAEPLRYESSTDYRFENSDLFALGPLVAYLREHPRGVRPRTVFLGDSQMWGYGVDQTETVAAQFQRLTPEEQVLNLAINGSGMGTCYLISKAIIDSIDTIYVLESGQGSRPNLPDLIPVDAEDITRFRLDRPDAVQRWLRARAESWQLYRDSYRLQSALFGIPTRLYVHRHKGDVLRAVTGRIREVPAPPIQATSGPAASELELTVSRAPRMPDVARAKELAASHRLQWDYASFVHAHRRRAVFIVLVADARELRPDLADLNAYFDPYVLFVKVRVPAVLKIDPIHFSPAGSRALAHALRSIHAVPTADR